MRLVCIYTYIYQKCSPKNIRESSKESRKYHAKIQTPIIMQRACVRNFLFLREMIKSSIMSGAFYNHN